MISSKHCVATRTEANTRASRVCSCHSLSSLDDLVQEGGAQLRLGSVPVVLLWCSQELRQHLRSTILVQGRCWDQLHGRDLCGAAAAAISGVVVKHKAVREEVILGLATIAHCDDASLELRHNKRVVVRQRHCTLRAWHCHTVHWLLDHNGLGG